MILPKHAASQCLACVVSLFIGLAAGCQAGPGERGRPGGGPILKPVSLADPVAPMQVPVPLAVSGASNEWIGCAIQLTNLPPSVGRVSWSLALSPRSFRSGRPLPDAPRVLRAGYQVVPVPADLNRPEYVRQTGRPAPADNPSGALLPLPLQNGRIQLAGLRDPVEPHLPYGPNSSQQPIVLWIDLHIPHNTPAGEYTASLDLHLNGRPRPAASIPLHFTIHEFDLPDQPSLRIIGRLDWQRLAALYPGQFQQVSPRLISRDNPATSPAVEILDRLVRLAHQHRTSITIPRLQPTVKWGAAGRPPQIDWADYDALIAPWLDSGPARMAWAIPEVDQLNGFDHRTQSQYWQQVIGHFEDRQWLDQSILFRDHRTPTRQDGSDLHVLQQAIALLEEHPQLSILLPHRDGDLSIADVERVARLMQSAEPASAAAHRADNANDSTEDRPDARPSRGSTLNRLLLRAPGAVYSMAHAPSTDEPPGAQWLAPDPTSSAGAGIAHSEPDLRLWAWLALLRDADTILWDGLLPRSTSRSAQQAPADTTWFYPGQWFGIEEPVPSLQLKWLRRAQQDHEYLVQAVSTSADELIDVRAMARLLVRPVLLPADRHPDPLHALLSGTSDPAAWEEARQLLAQAIVLGRDDRQRPRPEDLARRMELSLQAVHWTVPLARPVLIPRTTDWSWPADTDDSSPGNWIHLRLGIEIYTPTLTTGHGNQVEWISLPPGWAADSQPLVTPPLQTYEITPVSLDARINLNEIESASLQPLEIRFTDGYSGEHTHAQFSVPVARSGFRTDPVLLDGSLEEWHGGEAIHLGPMVGMFNRPAIQRQPLQPSATESAVYAAWNEDALLLAFRLEDATAGGLWWRNFVDYQLRRAWGEDLCQILIQPVYMDNTTGPILHVVCKPRGQWVEQKTTVQTGPQPSSAGGGQPPPPPPSQEDVDGATTPFQNRLISRSDVWQPFEGAGIRYASTLDRTTWRGEIAIPWEALLDPGRGRPALLRFNFSHHQHSAGQSASWAGPVDFGRDHTMMGLLILRQPLGREEPPWPRYPIPTTD
jgi:hypothetical protein